MPESARLMSAYFVAELIGTFLLVVSNHPHLALSYLADPTTNLSSTSFAQFKRLLVMEP